MGRVKGSVEVGDTMKLSLITGTRERANTLASCALPSVLMQTDCQFEWIVINDGADPQTREIGGVATPTLIVLWST